MKSFLIACYMSIALQICPVSGMSVNPRMWWEVAKLLVDLLDGGTKCAAEYTSSSECNVLLCDCHTYAQGAATSWTECH